MKKTLRMLALLLAVFTVLAAFAACKKKPTVIAPEETTPEDETDEGYENDLEAKDLGAQEFVIFDANDHPELHVNYSENMEGTIVEKALYSRDSYLEQRNNLYITYFSMNPSDNVQETMMLLKSAGDRPYDIMISTACSSEQTGGRLPALAVNGVLADLASLPTVDLTNKWWSPWINTQLSLGGKTYFTTGDIVASVYDAPMAVYANRDLLVDYGLLADPTELYQIVKDGEWTFEYMKNLTKDMTRDVNDDGVYHANDDFFGIVSQPLALTTDALLTGFGFELSSVVGDTIVINENIEILERYTSLLKNTLITPKYDTHQNDIINITFKNDRAIFLTHFVEAATHGLRDMATDFLVLPAPKASAEQDGYRSCINGWVNCFIAVPSFDIAKTDYAEDIGYLLEAMARASYDIVRPEAFDNIVMLRAIKDPGSYEMLEIIFNSLYLDYQCIYNFGQVSTVISNYVFGTQELTSNFASAKDMAKSEAEIVAGGWLGN